MSIDLYLKEEKPEEVIVFAQMHKIMGRYILSPLKQQPIVINF